MKNNYLADIYRRIRGLLQKGARVLLYHRVAEEYSDPQLLCVKPANFIRHMEYLRRYYQPVTLEALSECVKSGNIHDRLVAVTFDDGYADNLTQALPILRRFNIPATVFAATGYIGGHKEFIPDTLERCLLNPERLPQCLELTIANKKYSWQMNTHKNYAGKWNVKIKSDPTPRHSCYRQLHKLIHPLDYENRRVIIESLDKWAEQSRVVSNRRPLDINELKILDSDPLIEVGSHGVNHLLLSKQSLENQWLEIYQSKQRLEELLSHPIQSFSYPYGSMCAVSPDTVKLVKKAGFQLACANFPALITKNSDLFFLPRFIVRNWEIKEFANRINQGISNG